MTAPLRRAAADRTAPQSRARLRLGMAQLSPWGLSEQWLLRDCGDRHWALIAGAAGQAGTDFRDAEGRPVYAAFCTTSLQLAPIAAPPLGEEAAIASRLFSLGPNRLGSLHLVSGPQGPLGRVAMVSCFLCHDGTGSNRRLLRSALPGLRPPPAAPPELAALAARARIGARAARDMAAGSPLLRYQPVPALDFNAAGLLYFPAYSKIAEIARPAAGPLERREITYLGNLDPGEAVLAEAQGGGLLLRAEEGRVLAEISGSAA
ncbi:Pnap_2097 family protein [Poseidonocella sp. HB161398]|uniref:Pnap_2097 family protein n=1 Tax=Poseidonocella sp. HB161398 TaxID=2320855 RepID=UPI001107F8BC|nr:Pnap_2097 family protein [Poseidonocella sp. HB161398]